MSYMGACMRIGYPCINRTIGCKANRTFRLKSYSEERLVTTVQDNLDCLKAMLRFNAANSILFLRIASDLIPFASHPINRVDWEKCFSTEFCQIGDLVRNFGMRISMHPDQFVVINSPDTDVFNRSVAELVYHARVLDAMGLDMTAKIQLHVGGVYRDRKQSMERFTQRFFSLPEVVRRRLAIENDDRLYTFRDCLTISSETGVPVVLDVFHHQVNGSGDTVKEVLEMVGSTWGDEHGPPMVDYSLQKPGGRRGSHAASLDVQVFARFLGETRPYDFDIMLEIKDKEESALRAVRLAREDERFFEGRSKG